MDDEATWQKVINSDAWYKPGEVLKLGTISGGKLQIYI